MKPSEFRRLPDARFKDRAFLADASGRISQLALNRAGNSSLAPRVDKP